ncbi:hypothetical protein LNP05_29545 [Klebsiella pneumoniae subsp. pneumoniae]|nr:hypothetical protein [Klebsiella pneumoniae subsp. pneumoniae]
MRAGSHRVTLAIIIGFNLFFAAGVTDALANTASRSTTSDYGRDCGYGALAFMWWFSAAAGLAGEPVRLPQTILRDC